MGKPNLAWLDRPGPFPTLKRWGVWPWSLRQWVRFLTLLLWLRTRPARWWFIYRGRRIRAWVRRPVWGLPWRIHVER